MNRRGFLRWASVAILRVVGLTMVITCGAFFVLYAAGFGPPSVFEIIQAMWVLCGGLFLVFVCHHL